MLCCGWLVFSSCDWCISILAVPVGSLSDPLFCSSPVVVFLDRGQPCFWNFNSTIPVDVVRVMKSYENCLFDPAHVPMWITVNKLYLIPKRVVSSVVGVLWNGGGLGMGESDVSVMFFYPVLHRSSSLANVNFAAFTGNSVNNAQCFIRFHINQSTSSPDED